MNQDIQDQLLNQVEFNRLQTEQKKILQRELLQAADYMNELEEKVYNANKTSLELLKQLKDSEDEIDGLKHYILELKSRMAVYIPFTEDEVDVKLAEFINNYPERSKLKIMFLRESQGVYQFGSRRIAVKVERDKINSNYLNI